MNALIRKNLPKLLLLAIPGIVTFATILLDRGSSGVWRTWVLPGIDIDFEVLLVSIIGGFLLGSVLFLSDNGDAGSFEWLVHRGLSMDQVFWARAASSAVIVSLWIAVPVMIQAAVYGAWEPGLSYYDPGNLGPLLALWSPVVPAWAAGALVQSLRVKLPVRVLVSAAAMLMLIQVAFHVAMPPSATESRSALLFAATQIGIGAVLTIAARRLFRDRCDLDRPFERRSAWPAYAFVLIAMASSTGFVVNEIQGDEFHDLLRSYPDVIVADDGSAQLGRYREDRRGFEQVGADHQPTGKAAVGREYNLYQALLTETAPLQEPRSWRHEGTFALGRDERAIDSERDVWLTPAGDLVLMRWNRRYNALDAAPEIRILQHPDGARFDHSIQGGRSVEGGEVDEGVALILADTNLDRIYVFEAEAGVEVPLPNGDRFIEFTTLAEERTTNLWTSRPRWLGVRGELGTYIWRNAAFEEAPEHLIRSGDPARFEIVMTEPDALEPSIAIRTLDGDTTFEHTYRFRTWGEMWHGYFLRFLGLYRAPALQVVSAFGEPQRRMFHGPAYRGRADYLDPTMARGRSLAWLIASLIVGVLCGLWSYRRMAHLGAPMERRWFWCLGSGLTGPVGLLANVLMERPRAWLRQPTVSAPAPVLRIQSLSA